jgi:hypothetical protein
MDSTAKTKVEFIEEAARLGYVVVECPKAISRQQLKDAVASTIRKIRFAKEA